MTARSCLKAVAGTLIAAACLAVAAVVLLPRLLPPDTFRAQILSMAQRALHRRISYEKVSISWRFAPAVVFRGVTVAERSGDAAFLEVSQLSFKLALLPLLHKEVLLREVVVDRPVMVLSRDRTGSFNIDDLLKGKPSEYRINLNSLSIKNGRVRFSDSLADPGGFSASLENLELSARGLSRGETTRFKLSASIPGGRGPTVVSATGTTRLPAREAPLRDAQFDVTLAAKALDLGRYWPYYGRHLPFKQLGGQLDIKGACKGKPGEFTAKVNLSLRNLRFDYPRVFHAVLTPRDLRIAGEVELTPRDLAVKSLDLAVDGLRVTGSCILGEIHAEDPRITARAVTSTFRLEEFHRYIPYGIIPRDTADFIERHIRGGIYRLDEGRLNGRISQIMHMEQGENYNVLFIRGRVEKGVVDFGPGVPTFNNLKGNLEMRGKDFLLRSMTGNFGGSPFTLEGKIGDYPLGKPLFPFAMAITPGKAEVAWLLRQQEPAMISFSGPSILRLSGAGAADDYRLDGRWELTGADYRVRDLVHKPAGTPNGLRFAARLGKREARLFDFRYELPPLDVAANATYRYHDRLPLTFTVATNRLVVDPLIHMLPELEKYQSSGSVQARISGSGNPAEPGNIRLRGDLTLAEFSARPLKQVSPLSGVTGAIHLAGTTLETKQLIGKVGTSPFTVTGRVAGLSNPTADLVFSSPRLHLEDFGFHSHRRIPEVNNLSGAFSLKAGNLTIASLSGQVSRSTFALSGEIPGGDAPRISLQVDFPYLRVEDFEPLTELESAGWQSGHHEGASLQARVTSAAGSVRDLPFKEFDTELALEGSRLAVKALRVGMLGGTVSGNGEADFAAGGVTTAYRAQYRLDHVDAGGLLRIAGVKPQLTGLLAAEGELTARGKSREELRKTAHVTARLQLRDGELIPFSSSTGGAGTRIPFAALAANLSLGEGVLTVQGFKADIFSGTVSGSGRVDLAAKGGPVYQTRYRLDHLDTAQFLRAAGIQEYFTGMLAAEGELDAKGSGWDEVRHSVHGEADIDLSDGLILLPANGGTGRAPFKALKSHLTVSRNQVGIQSARLEAFGGVITGDGEADLDIADGAGYQLSCRAENVDATEFFNLFRVTKELSGRLTLQAELTAKGSTVAAVEKTLRGSVGMQMEKGVINKYRILAKVFSILNVSQLLKFRLPDMVSNGMPYNRIEVTFSLRDGIASTDDLAIHSPSLKMTAVGNSDLVRKTVDLEIGVQPLQTVGKIISRIPIVGWILAGERRQFLVFYFEAKGPWTDPKVSSVEMTALPTSVLNIFKRVFRLPETLVTAPGKVL